MKSLVNASICSLVMWKTVFRHLRKAFIMICKDSENFMSLSSSTNSRKSRGYSISPWQGRRIG